MAGEPVDPHGRYIFPRPGDEDPRELAGSRNAPRAHVHVAGGWSHLLVLCGPTKCGKSTYAKQLVARSPRLVVIDPMAEYSVGGVEWGLKRCLERLTVIAERRVPRFRLACRVGPEEAEEVLRFCWEFCSDFENPDPRQQIELVVDEAHRLSRPGDKDTPFDWACTMGRRFATRIIVCTQRLARISRDATSNAAGEKSLVMWRCDEPSVIDDLKKRKGDEAVLRMLALGKHEHLAL